MISICYIVCILGIAAALSIPLGKWMHRILCPEKETALDAICHAVIGKASYTNQNWKQYAAALLLFNLILFAAAALILMFQQNLPWNPDKAGALSPSLIFHTVSSFVTNTNQQHYSGESSMSFFSQIFALMWLQFTSAATGLAAFTAAARWFGNSGARNNFYLDLARSAFGVLLPAAALTAFLLVLCGLPMTLEGAAVAHTLEGALQTIARGPVAAFTAIKQLGTNGGGFFGANSTHPLENINFYSNLIECVSLLVIPMACVWLYGHITKHRRHARIIFLVMLGLLLIKITVATALESAPAPALRGLPVAETANPEGKELRFGTAASPVWTVFTTCSSNGSVNSMHSSLNPLTGLVPLIGMWLNVTFGGIGVGFLGILSYVLVAVFISGMMVGRTPEYLGKKVETREMKFAIPILLLHPLCILGGTALFCLIPAWGRDTVLNPGFHGFTELLYEFTSASANNGSGFEGLRDNTLPWNLATGILMLVGRYLPILLTFAIAGSLYQKKEIPETVGTLKTDTPLFGGVLAGTLLFIGALLFLPVAVLGPVAEYLTTAGI